MQVETKQAEFTKFRPVDIKITIDNLEEYSCIRHLLNRDILVPSFLEERGFINSKQRLLLSYLMKQINGTLTEVEV